MGNREVTGARTLSSPQDWSQIDKDVLELILLKLPEISVIRAACVCSRWNSIARGEEFTQFYLQQRSKWRACPRFTVKGSQYCFRQNEAGKYDILSDLDSSEVPYLLRPDEEKTCYEGAGGLFYFFAGPHQTVVFYKLSVMQKEWLVTPEMKFRKHEPIVGVVRSGNSMNCEHKLVVAGGMADLPDNDEDLAVEIYDSVTGIWIMGSPLPHEFRSCTTSLFMNPAVYKGKFYAYDNYASFCSVLDVDSNRWSAASVVRRRAELNQSYLVEISTGLSLVGVQSSGSRDLSFCVWDVDPKSLQVKELVQNTVILNVRPGLPSPCRRVYDGLLDCLNQGLEFLPLLVACIIVLSYGWFSSTRCRLQNLLESFSSRLPSCPASHALRREARQVAKTRWLPWHSSGIEPFTSPFVITSRPD